MRSWPPALLLPLLALLSARPLRELDERLGVREDEIDVLRRAPMLNVLPVPSIEHLASRLRHRTFPEAAVVFAEGDPGGAYYVIADGKAEVVGDGALVAVLGPGDSFGEIAVVKDVPRTATVRAATTLDVFELDQDAFLDAIGSSPATSDAAAAAVAGHLANFTPGAVVL